MNHLSTIKIYDTSKVIINDVQLWHSKEDLKLPTISSCSYISFIKYTCLPISLVHCSPITVYSNDSTTSQYFKENLVNIPLSNNRNDIGLLCKVDSDTYLVFYYDTDAVKMIVLNFSNHLKIRPYLNDSVPENTFVDFSQPMKPRTSTVLIDRIIEKKKQRSNPFMTTTGKSDNSSLLTNQDQINSAINRIISSGLRIRGLTPNQMTSHNDKLAIKEIHQMTFKAAQFSLRKQNYSFNKSEKPKKVRLNDLQDIVENLLQLFVDVE
ncbi:SLD7 Mitochondrial morphogenesis protein SLD7 [Candida maltosa Xu316]